MVAPAMVPSFEHPPIPAACQPRCVCRAGGRSPKSPLVERSAANLQVRVSCCQQPSRGAGTPSLGGWLWCPPGRDIPVTAALVPVPLVGELCGVPRDPIPPRCAGRCLLGLQQPAPGLAHGRGLSERHLPSGREMYPPGARLCHRALQDRRWEMDSSSPNPPLVSQRETLLPSPAERSSLFTEATADA